MGYLWLKALHVIAIIAWMAGLLYLPRLYVYHCEAAAGSALSEKLKVMETRLLRYIMNPAMLVVWLTGLILVVWGHWERAGWLHLKLLFVVVLSALHMMMAAQRRAFAEDRNTRSQGFYRVFNEGPTLCMIVIVVAVIVKPF